MKFVIFKEIETFEAYDKYSVSYEYVELFEGTQKQAYSRCTKLDKTLSKENREPWPYTFPFTRIEYQYSEDLDILDYYKERGFTIKSIEKSIALNGIYSREDLLKIVDTLT